MNLERDRDNQQWLLEPPPKEIGVCENDVHVPRRTSNFGMADFCGFLANWLNGALAGTVAADLDKVGRVGQKDGPGPHAEPARGVYLPDCLGSELAGLTAAQQGPA